MSTAEQTSVRHAVKKWMKTAIQRAGSNIALDTAGALEPDALWAVKERTDQETPP